MTPHLSQNLFPLVTGTLSQVACSMCNHFPRCSLGLTKSLDILAATIPLSTAIVTLICINFIVKTIHFRITIISGLVSIRSSRTAESPDMS